MEICYNCIDGIETVTLYYLDLSVFKINQQLDLPKLTKIYVAIMPSLGQIEFTPFNG